MTNNDVELRLLAEQLKNVLTDQQEKLVKVDTKLTLQRKVNKARELDDRLSGLVAAAALYFANKGLYASLTSALRTLKDVSQKKLGQQLQFVEGFLSLQQKIAEQKTKAVAQNKAAQTR